MINNDTHTFNSQHTSELYERYPSESKTLTKKEEKNLRSKIFDKCYSNSSGASCVLQKHNTNKDHDITSCYKSCFCSFLTVLSDSLKPLHPLTALNKNFNVQVLVASVFPKEPNFLEKTNEAPYTPLLIYPFIPENKEILKYIDTLSLSLSEKESFKKILKSIKYAELKSRNETAVCACHFYDQNLITRFLEGPSFIPESYKKILAKSFRFSGETNLNPGSQSDNYVICENFFTLSFKEIEKILQDVKYDYPLPVKFESVEHDYMIKNTKDKSPENPIAEADDKNSESTKSEEERDSCDICENAIIKKPTILTSLKIFFKFPVTCITIGFIFGFILKALFI